MTTADRARLGVPAFSDPGFAAAVPAAVAAPPAQQSAYQRFVKPVYDRLIAIVLLVLLSPVLLALAVAVRIAIGPGIVFRQSRVGLGGRPFTIYKFRTMRADRRRGGSQVVGVDRRRTHKHRADPRHTGLGRILRRWSLDELPQLWNVVRGDMSLVGPRPELVEVVERYQPWQHRRHAVKPGLTGLWQVTARDDGRAMHEHSDIDIVYVERAGFRTDMQILLITVPVVLGLRKGH